MRHLKIVSLCLVAAFALAAVAATTASATLPEVLQCAKAKKETVEWKEGTKTKKKAVYTGAYNNKKCSEPNSTDVYRIKGAHPGPEGKYELEPWNAEGKGGQSKVKEFTGKGGTSFLEIVKLGQVECTKGSDTGFFTGPKQVGDVNVIFTGCHLNEYKCKSAGAGEGEIKTYTLKGEIGFVGEKFGVPVSQTTVGVDLTPESGEYLAEFVCQTDPFRVSGSVIGEVEAPYNVFTKEVKLKFEEAGGVQAIKSFEGMPEDTLTTETWNGSSFNKPGSESGQSGEAVNKGEELELAA